MPCMKNGLVGLIRKHHLITKISGIKFHLNKSLVDRDALRINHDLAWCFDLGGNYMAKRETPHKLNHDFI